MGDESDEGGARAHGANERRAAAARREQLAQAAARREASAAQALIDDFVANATAAGLPPQQLRARLLGGQEVRTDKSGWYLRKDHSVAVGTDRAYYILTVAGGGLMTRLRGVQLKATPPTLVVGLGGRDGETGDLAEFLARALAGEVE